MSDTTQALEQVLRELVFAEMVHHKIHPLCAIGENHTAGVLRLTENYPKIRSELLEVQSLVFELFKSHCWDASAPAGEPSFDHMCNSTYEDAQEYLLRVGIIKPEECVRKNKKEVQC
jgi:hypothetical protein